MPGDCPQDLFRAGSIVEWRKVKKLMPSTAMSLGESDSFSVNGQSTDFEAVTALSHLDVTILVMGVFVGGSMTKKRFKAQPSARLDVEEAVAGEGLERVYLFYRRSTHCTEWPGAAANRLPAIVPRDSPP